MNQKCKFLWKIVSYGIPSLQNKPCRQKENSEFYLFFHTVVLPVKEGLIRVNPRHLTLKHRYNLNLSLLKKPLNLLSLFSKQQNRWRPNKKGFLPEMHLTVWFYIERKLVLLVRINPNIHWQCIAGKFSLLISDSTCMYNVVTLWHM